MNFDKLLQYNSLVRYSCYYYSYLHTFVHLYTLYSQMYISQFRTYILYNNIKAMLYIVRG